MTIAEIRRALGLTVETLAREIGCHSRTVARWEEAERVWGERRISPLAAAKLRVLERRAEKQGGGQSDETKLPQNT